MGVLINGKTYDMTVSLDTLSFSSGFMYSVSDGAEYISAYLLNENHPFPVTSGTVYYYSKSNGYDISIECEIGDDGEILIPTDDLQDCTGVLTGEIVVTGTENSEYYRYRTLSFKIAIMD